MDTPAPTERREDAPPGPTVEQSLALLETIIADGPMGVAFIDRDFRYRRVNARLAEMNGWSVADQLGRTVEEVLGPEQWAKRRAFFEETLAGRACLEVTVPGAFRLPSGQERHVVSSYLPVQVGGVVVGVAALVRDVTEQTAAEEGKRQSEARKATILEVALDCIVSIDADGRIVEFNPAAERTFGYTRAEVMGRIMAELIIPPALRSAHYHGFGHYLTTGEGPILRQRIEVPALRSNGEEFPIEMAIVPIEEDGKPLFTAYLRDISDRKRDEAERERLLREVKEAADRQRAFLRDVLASVTDGKLRLCHVEADLPAPLPPVSDLIPLSLSWGTRELRHQTEAAALKEGFAEERWYDLVTAASEAAMNAVVHAGGGEGQVCGEPGGPIQVWVRDHGTGIDVAHLPRATLEKGYTTAGTLGHGMKMMLQTVDRIFLLTGRTGTTVVLEQDRDAPELMNW